MSQIGVTGLAVMGANLARNIAGRGVPTAVHNRTASKTRDFMSEYESEGAVHRHRDDGGVRRGARAPAADHRDGQGRSAGRRRDRRARAAARRRRHRHRRRQLALPRHAPAHRRVPREGPALHRHGRLRRRGGRAARAEHHAGRRARGLWRGRGGLHHDRRAGRRRAVLRLRRPGRRRPLREDGAQRHRVRRHAADRRGLRPPALRHRARRAGDQGHLRRLERGRPRVVPDRDHGHGAGQDRRGDRQAAGRRDRRPGRAEGHRALDVAGRARARRAADRHHRGRLRPLAVRAARPAP